MSKKPVVLMILDGYGLSDKKEGNGIANANTPVMDKLMAEYPFVKGYASGLAVGLPDGQMGNSEVGHLNMGAGRIVYQELTRITKSIEDGDFFENEELLGAIENCKKNNSDLHLYGLLSDGGVHSHLTHVFALLELAKKNGLKNVYVHGFMDGRDTATDGGKDFINQLYNKMDEIGVGKIASIMGRYYAMDRDNRWDRIEAAYKALTEGVGNEAACARCAINDSYAAGKTDEFVVPTDGYYVYGDNIKLKLTSIGTDKVGGKIALQKGTYTFKIDNYGTLLGYSKTFTDTTKGLTFNKKFKSSTTLVATGGTYTFQFNTKTNTLVVKYDKNLPNDYLIGDLNTILSPVKGKTIAVGSTYLAAGTYKFKLSSGDVVYGYNKVINNTTNGNSLSLNSKYSSYLTLNATGGTYTFTLNTKTKKLVVGYVPAKDEKADDVHVSGDINLVLDDKGGESNVAKGTVKLSEGTYSFKIYNYGTAYTIGSKIVDSGAKTLKSSYSANVTLIASGGTYTFSFDKTTGALKVSNK